MEFNSSGFRFHHSLLSVLMIVGLSAVTAAGPPAVSKIKTQVGAAQRLMRIRREAHLRGDSNRIPALALTRAVLRMRAMPTPARASSPWTFIGPQPIVNGQSLTGTCDANGAPIFGTLTVNGRVTAIGFGAGGSIYVGSAHGGVWKSVDSGSTWTPLMDQEISTAVGALAVVPGSDASSDIIYVGSGEGDQSGDSEFGQGIFKSVDGGATFEQFGLATFDQLGFTKIVTAFDPTTPNDPSTLFATTANAEASSQAGIFFQVRTGKTGTPGLYKSSDHGQTWTLLSGSGALPAGAAFDVVAPRVLPFQAASFDGTVVDQGNCGCAGSATISLDQSQHARNFLSVKQDPNSGFDIGGQFFVVQSAGICDDYSGQYSCQGTVRSLSGGQATFQCSGATSLSFNGTFNVNPDDTGALSGAWSMSDSCGPDVVQDGTFNFNAQPAVYAAVSGQGVYKSSDGGSSWAQLGNGLPAGGFRHALDISADGNTLVVARALSLVDNNNNVTYPFDNVYTSSDAGVTWAPGGGLPNVPCQNEDQGFYDVAVTMDPNNTSTIYLGLSGSYASFDGGQSFAFIGANNHADYHALKVDSTGTLFVGNDGGIYRSFDGGADWDDSMDKGLGITQFQGIGMPSTGTKVLTGGSQDNGTERYTGKLAWSQTELGDGGYAEVDPKHPNVFFATRFNQAGIYQLLRSTSAGKKGTYAPIPPPAGNDPVEFYAPYALDPRSGARVLFGTNRVWESCTSVVANPRTGKTKLACNGATAANPNWMPISAALDHGCSGCSITDIAIARSNPAVAYVVTDAIVNNGAGTGPFIWVSTNSTCANPPPGGGGFPAPCTFTDISANLIAAGLPAGTPLTSVAVSPKDPKTVLIAASGFTGKHVFKSTDGGNSFADITGGLPDVPALDIIVDACAPAKSYLLGTDIGVFHSADAGGSWQNFNLGTLPNVPVFQVRQNGSMVVAATHGRGAWIIKGCP